MQYPPTLERPTTSDSHVAVKAQETWVVTETFYWVQIEAEDGYAAIERAELEYSPTVSAALSLILRRPVVTQAVEAVSRDPHDGSCVQQSSVGECEPLPNAAIDQTATSQVLRALSRDGAERVAARHIYQAQQYIRLSVSAGDLGKR